MENKGVDFILLKTGEIKHAREIGRNTTNHYIWQACEVCAKERWVLLKKGQPVSFRCLACAMQSEQVRYKISESRKGQQIGENNPKWRGGSIIDSGGYIHLWFPSHPRHDGKGYIMRSHLVLEEKLGRPMLSSCIVHYLNGIRHDDRPGNVIEVTRGQHNTIHGRRNGEFSYG